MSRQRWRLLIFNLFHTFVQMLIIAIATKQSPAEKAENPLVAFKLNRTEWAFHISSSLVDFIGHSLQKNIELNLTLRAIAFQERPTIKENLSYVVMSGGKQLSFAATFWADETHTLPPFFVKEQGVVAKHATALYFLILRSKKLRSSVLLNTYSC